VCSPRLDPPLRTPADLAQHGLIHVVQTADAWSGWLRAAGVPDLVPRRSVTYDHASLALSAAESGQGVALSMMVLCAPRLREKRLCRPFRETARSDSTYHFVCRPESLDDPRVAALRDWLVERLARADALAERASADAE
jgi:LysR family glycine cleavage system transcriptional activator